MVLPSHIPPLAGAEGLCGGRGRSFLVPGGAHTPCKILVCALMEREGRTRRWSPLHTSLLLRGGGLVRFGPGAFFFAGAGTPFSAKILIFCCISGVISVI